MAGDVIVGVSTREAIDAAVREAAGEESLRDSGYGPGIAPGTSPALTVAQARAAVEAANLAPSIHNTQPWRWRLADGVLHLYADRSRQLAVADPSGRQLVVSCGAALHQAQVSLRAQGLITVVAGPDGPDGPDALATLRVVGERAPDAHDLALAQAMFARQTDRRPFRPGRISRAVVGDLRRIVEQQGVWLVPLDRPDQRLEVAVLLGRADADQVRDRAYQAELASWRRDEMTATDGIPGSVLPARPGQRQSEFVIRDFDLAGGAQAPAADEPGEPGPGPVEHPDAVALFTDADGQAAWLRSGRALAAVLLEATARGLAASPLGQVIDLAYARERLRRVAGGMGHVQMLLRLGYPDPDQPPLGSTPRRPVDEVLDVGGSLPA